MDRVRLAEAYRRLDFRPAAANPAAALVPELAALAESAGPAGEVPEAAAAKTATPILMPARAVAGFILTKRGSVNRRTISIATCVRRALPVRRR